MQLLNIKICGPGKLGKRNSIPIIALFVFLLASIQIAAAEERVPVLTGQKKNSLISDLNVHFQADIKNAHFFDTNEYESGAFIMPTWEELSDWNLSSNGQLPLAMVDKEDLQRIPTLNVQARRQLSEAMDFLLRYRVSYLKALTNEQESLVGLAAEMPHRWQQRYSAEANMKWSLVQAKIGLSFEKNNLGDNQDSPTRQSWVAAVTLTPLDDLDLHLGFNYRNTFSLTESDEERQENQASAVLRLSYMLSDDTYLSTEYQYTDNKSNDPQYDFQRDLLLLNVSMGF